MGCASSSPELETSIGIDDQLNHARLQGKQKVKLLLLGGGESGKSTVLKQMRILHGPAWSEEELRMYGVIIRSNVLIATCKLLKQICNNSQQRQQEQLAMESAPPSSYVTPKQAYDYLVAHLVDKTATDFNEAAAAATTKNGEDWIGHCPRAGRLANEDAQLFLRHWKYIQTFMESQTMKKALAHHSTLNVIEGHVEYVRNVARIASPSYRPTDRDILLARARTNHVTTERYNMHGIEFEFFDVGGQRALRHKWMHCFDNVDAVIFVAALSGYDQTLAEAKGTNRMVEALDLFRSVCNHRDFEKSSIILLLNKKDVFAEKILHTPIASQGPFNDYAGRNHDFHDGVQYFTDKFLNLLDYEKNVFVRETCATDTKNMEFVLDAVRAVIMEECLS